MPTISNATVATGTGLSTAGNGGRKLVRLDNGWLVVVVKKPDYRYFYISKDNGATFAELCSLYHQNLDDNDITMVSKGTDVHVVYGWSITEFYHFKIDTITQQNVQIAIASAGHTRIEPPPNQYAIGNISLAINEAGTELHAAWSSKNATYPNSFNIRYAKGPINGDGSVTWGAVEQRTTASVSGYFEQNHSIGIANGKPYIVREAYNGTNYSIQALQFDGTTWNNRIVYAGSTYPQSSPSAIFVPQSVNGLANGRIWVAWHGKDATDSAKFNVRVSYSDDGGVTWATPVKLTTGNLYDRQNVTLAADQTGKVFALYEAHQWSPDVDIYMRTFSGGSWGAPVAVAEAGPAAESNPSALVDYSLQMTTPPFVFMSGAEGIRFSGNFNLGASVSPASGALGNKETATLTAYTVTPEAGSTVTSIVEKVNGVTVNTFNNPASLSRTLTVPTATWDTLAYFATHTASITVTDSNGATTVTTYSFDKTLGNGASLLEATKANADAKNRIITKRDALAAQVGLSAGATFDAISAQLASGQAIVKRNAGTVTSSSTQLNSAFHVTIPIATIGFVPKSVQIMNASSGTPLASVNIDSAVAGTTPSVMQAGTSNATLDGTTFYINSTAVRIPVGGSQGNTLMKWIAYG